jgi:hypothetical protein
MQDQRASFKQAEYHISNNAIDELSALLGSGELELEDSCPLFNAAVRMGNLDACKAILATYPWVAGTDNFGLMGARFLHALRMAAWRKHIDVLRWLLWLPVSLPLFQYTDTSRADISLIMECLADREMEERFAEFLSPHGYTGGLLEAGRRKLVWFSRTLFARGHVLQIRTEHHVSPLKVISKVVPFLVVACQSLECVRQFSDNDILVSAVCSSNIEALTLMLQLGCSPNNGSDMQRAIWCCVTDHRPWRRHHMVKLLLDAGASPFLYDARDTLLLDCVTAGYWWALEARCVQIGFTASHEHAEIVTLLRRAMGAWTPARHHMFPAGFRARVRCLLLCNQWAKGSRLWIPRDLMYLLISHTAMAEVTHRDPRVLDRFLKRHLEATVAEAIPQALQPKKTARKRVYQELLLGAADAREAAYQRTFSGAPAIVGKLSVTTGENLVEHDIPNPLTPGMRELSVGRRSTHADHMAHIILEGADHNISRIHFILRVNQDRQWQVRVTGYVPLTQDPPGLSRLLMADEEFVTLDINHAFNLGDAFTFRITSFI